MAEYISREELIKALETDYNRSWCSKPQGVEEYVEGARDEYDDVLKIVCGMKAADVQPVNQWILVEEKVPDVSGNYLCYLATGDFEVLYFDRGIEDGEYNNDYPFGVWNTYPSEDGGECREWIEVLEVTHWQPLPEPPKDGAKK